MKSYRKLGLWQWLLALMAIAGLATASWSLVTGKQGRISSAAPARIVIALPTQPSSGALYLATDQKLFAQRGVDVAIKPFQLGKLGLEAMLRGEADLAVLADTPFMFAVMRGEKIAAVSTIFGSRHNMAVVARKESRINSAKDLAGKTIGTPFGTNAQYFLDGLLVTNGLPRSAVKIIDLKPDDMVPALQSGKVDAVTIWHPNFLKIQQALGERTPLVFGADEFFFRFLLVGKKDYLTTHAAQLQQILAAINEANIFIREHPAAARSIIAKSVGLDEALLTKDFDAGNYYLSLDQTLLLALDDQTRWAMKLGLVPTGTRPNYLDFIRTGPLVAVDADAVKIIR